MSQSLSLIKILVLALSLVAQACSYQHTKMATGESLQKAGFKATHVYQRQAQWVFAPDTPIMYVPISNNDHPLPRFVALINAELTSEIQAQFTNAHVQSSSAHSSVRAPLGTMTQGVMVTAELLELNDRRNSWVAVMDGPELHNQAPIGRDSVRIKLRFKDIDSGRILDQVLVRSRAARFDDASLYSGELLRDAFHKLFETLI